MNNDLKTGQQSTSNNNISNKKSKKFLKIFLTILKVLFFYIYIPGLIIYHIVKLLIHLILKFFKFIFKLLKKLFFFIREHLFMSCITTSCILFIIAGIIGIINFKKNYNTIYLTNRNINDYSESMKIVDTKLTNIEGKISTLDSINNTDIKVYSGDLIIKEEKIDKKKRWKIDLDYLSDGINIVDISVKFKNGKTKNQKFYIYNNFEGNSTGLDKNDNDNDGIVNYKEIAVGTDKDKKDSDGDGLSDYDEIFKSFTNPLLSDSDSDGLNDFLSDNDKDSINNSDEIKYKTNPNLSDSDGDGLSDYDELFKYSADPNKKDSDGDGLSDYDEIILNTSPNKIDTKIMAKYKSSDNIAYVSLNNISVKQYNSLQISDSGNILGLKDSSSYISGPYNYEMDGNFDNAVISFNFNSSILNENSNPTIYYVNLDNNKLEALDTTISGNTASANVNHFSNYILLDKNEIDNKVNNAPKVDGSNVSDSSVSNTEFILLATPFFNAFGVPMHLYIVDGSDKVVKNTETTMNKLIKDFDSSLNLNVKYSSISKTRANVMDTIFSSFEEKTLEHLSTNDEDGTSKNIFESFFTYKHFYSGADLEIFLTGEVKGQIDDATEVDKEKDSNHDGISDYYTKLICNGQLTTDYGTNPFKNISYSEIQSRKGDFDGDGLKNGDEIEIVKSKDSYFVIQHSSPVNIDSDNDSVNDKKDKLPMIPFDSSFKEVNSIDYVPKTPTQDKLERKSDSVYNTETGNDCGLYNCDVIEALAVSEITVANSMPAAFALSHFLDNTGTILDFNSDWSLIENTYSGEDNFVDNVEKIMAVGEDTVKRGDTLSFSTKNELLGTDFSNNFEDAVDIGWWYAIGYTNANMTGEIKNIDNKKYEMILWYYIEDYYDWEPDKTLINGGFGGLVTDSQMYQLHSHGLARQYRIKIPYKMKITWNYGDRYYLSGPFSWDMPSSMTLKKLN